MSETFEKWNFRIPIIGIGRNMAEAFEDAIEHTIVEESFIENCEPELDCVVDENDEEIE